MTARESLFSLRRRRKVAEEMFLALLIGALVVGAGSFCFFVVGEWKFSALAGWLSVLFFIGGCVCSEAESRLKDREKAERG